MRVFLRPRVFFFIVGIAGLYLIFCRQGSATIKSTIPDASGKTPSELQELESARPGASPIVVKINSDGEGSFDVSRKDVYEIWMGRNITDITDIDAVNIDDESYPVIINSIKNRWIKIGSKNIKPVWGRHKIQVIRRGQKSGGVDDLDILLVSESKRKRYEDLLKRKDISYLFHDVQSNPIGRKEFYIPKSGVYELRAIVRPKKEKVRAYAINEGFKDGVSLEWNFRVSNSHGPVVGNRRSERAKGGIVRDKRGRNMLPVYVFGENFHPPQSLSYPLNYGMWRWMSNDGKIIIFNPLKAPMAADIFFAVASFKEARNLRVVLNGELLNTVALSEPEKKIDKRLLSRISDLKGLARASGRVERIKIKGAVLRPGVNKLVFRSIPSATLVGRDERFNVSVVMRDDVVVRPSPGGIKGATTYWENRAEFKAEAGDETLSLKDSYKGMEGEVAWITRGFDGVDLLASPLFILKYSLSDTEVQRMDVGFRIDKDGDGIEDIYFERAVSNKRPPGVNRFEIDLVREVYQVFPDINVDRLVLVGVDLFPHREWEADLSRTIKEGIYTYRIKGIMVASKEASVAVEVDNFEGLKGAKFHYELGRDGVSLDVSLILGGRKGKYSSSEFVMSLNRKLLRKSSIVRLPFQLTDKDVQAVNLWVGYDTSGDKRADRFVPVGVRVPISGFRFITRDMRAPMLLYEAKLPDDFPHGYTTAGRIFKNFIVLKDGIPRSPTWDNDFMISKEQAQVNGKTLVINLPRDRDPDRYNYELYYIPERWIVDSPRFPGFGEYAFDLNEVREYLPERKATPVAIKIVLEGMLSKPLNKEKEFIFHFMAPMYTYAVLPRLKGIEQAKNMPVFSIDNNSVNFDGKEIDRRKDELWLRKTLSLKEGAHTLDVREEGALEAYIVEIKPVGSGRLTTKGEDPPQITYTMINPTKYIVDVNGAKRPFTLVFSESYHEGWRAYLVGKKEVERRLAKDESWSALWSAWSDRGNRKEIEDHFVVNGYANGWIVPVGRFDVETRGSDQRNFQIVLEFKPQRLFETGVIISLATLLVCIGYLGYGWKRKRRKDGIV